MTNAVALIPARSGSVRIKHKNTRPLGKHPLLVYSIATALESGCFDKVLVSSDDIVTLGLAEAYGADVVKRPVEYATNKSPDIEWVKHALDTLGEQGNTYDIFSILRPTTPFRSVDSIRLAMDMWHEQGAKYHSLRAVAPVEQHAGKQWQIIANHLVPLLLQQPTLPFHSSQAAALPPLYMQTAGLEIAWTETAYDKATIAGELILPFIMQGNETIDLNVEADWDMVEKMIAEGEAVLPEVT